MTDFPIKITPCPIKEVIFEIRFTSSIPEDAVFGIIFNQFKKDYNNTATPLPLPILEVPAVVRNQDQNLMFSPHYKMEADLYNMQIGPKVISLTNIKKYVGWELFQSKILELYEKLKEINIINSFDQFFLSSSHAPAWELISDAPASTPFNHLSNTNTKNYKIYTILIIFFKIKGNRYGKKSL